MISWINYSISISGHHPPDLKAILQMRSNWKHFMLSSPNFSQVNIDIDIDMKKIAGAKFILKVL